MLTRYNTQIKEKERAESVETMTSWIYEEAEYAVNGY